MRGALCAVCMLPVLFAMTMWGGSWSRAGGSEAMHEALQHTALQQPEVSLQQARFTDNGDGTVTDSRTGLTWLKHANCFGTRTWDESMDIAAELHGGHTCDGFELRDGSAPGDWRLPTIREIMTLPMIEYFNPALSNAMGTGKWSEGDPFVGVSSLYYWSSSKLDDQSAWYMYLFNGVLGISEISQRYSVWPVKGRMHNVWGVEG